MIQTKLEAKSQAEAGHLQDTPFQSIKAQKPGGFTIFQAKQKCQGKKLERWDSFNKTMEVLVQKIR